MLRTVDQLLGLVASSAPSSMIMSVGLFFDVKSNVDVPGKHPTPRFNLQISNEAHPSYTPVYESAKRALE